MNHHRVPQIGLLFPLFPTQLTGREGERDTLFGEEGERETEEECNYSLGASGALLPTATAAAADKEPIWKPTW